MPPTLLITFLSGKGGSLADRIGPRLPMILGPAVVGARFVLLVFSGIDGSYIARFLPGPSRIGGGMALVIAPLTKFALSVEEKFSGVASGVNNAVARGAALLAVAILGAVLVSTFTLYLAEGIEASSLVAGEREAVLMQADRLAGIALPEAFGEVARAEASRIVRDAFVAGFRWVMGICAALAFLSSAIASVFIRPRLPHR